MRVATRVALFFLLIIDLREARRNGLWVLWDYTTMIMSDLQPSVDLVLTSHAFLFSSRTFLLLSHPGLVLHFLLLDRFFF